MEVGVQAIVPAQLIHTMVHRCLRALEVEKLVMEHLILVFMDKVVSGAVVVDA